MLGNLLKKDSVRRVFHTLWQAAAAILLTQLETPTASWSKKAIISALQAAALAALKAVLVS